MLIFRGTVTLWEYVLLRMPQRKCGNLPFRESLFVAWSFRKPVLKAATEGESREDPKRIYIDRTTGGYCYHCAFNGYTNAGASAGEGAGGKSRLPIKP
ncbi:MAG: hypothetical protein ACETWQ_13635 [Phycisphaerae bacterium]